MATITNRFAYAADSGYRAAMAFGHFNRLGHVLEAHYCETEEDPGIAYMVRDCCGETEAEKVPA